MTHFLDLFSGIGGFSLGAYWAGLRFDNHYFSEVDDYAIRVYQQRFPNAIGLGDITKIDGTKLPAGEWIIAGGFPCQDISVAGKGAGLAGKRSGLWYEYARIIGELRPRYAIMENVGALSFRGLDAVLGSLAEIGYNAEWQDIRASDVGAPHRRERLWIVAYPASRENNKRERRIMDEAIPRGRSVNTATDACSQDVADTERKGLEGLTESEFIQGCGSSFCCGSRLPQTLADPKSERAWDDCKNIGQISREIDASYNSGGTIGRDGRQINRQALADPPNGGNVRRDGKLEPAQGEVREHRGSAKDGRGEWWATEPNVGRVANGVPSRIHRLKCLGNSIVPQIAELIFRQAAFDEWRAL